MIHYDISVFEAFISVAIPFNLTSALTINSFYKSTTFKEIIFPYLNRSKDLEPNEKIDKIYEKLKIDISRINAIKENPLFFREDERIAAKIQRLIIDNVSLCEKYERKIEGTYIYNRIKPKNEVLMFLICLMYCIFYMFLSAFNSLQPVNENILIHINCLVMIYLLLISAGGTLKLGSEFSFNKRLNNAFFDFFEKRFLNYLAPFTLLISYLIFLPYIQHQYTGVNHSNITKYDFVFSTMLIPYYGHLFFIAKILLIISLDQIIFLYQYSKYKKNIRVIDKYLKTKKLW